MPLAYLMLFLFTNYVFLQAPMIDEKKYLLAAFLVVITAKN